MNQFIFIRFRVDRCSGQGLGRMRKGLGCLRCLDPAPEQTAILVGNVFALSAGPLPRRLPTDLSLGGRCSARPQMSPSLLLSFFLRHRGLEPDYLCYNTGLVCAEQVRHGAILGAGCGLLLQRRPCAEQVLAVRLLAPPCRRDVWALLVLLLCPF